MIDCVRQPHPTAEDARRAAALEAIQTGKLRSTFACSWCGEWHVGENPGRVFPCSECGSPIVIRRGRPVDPLRLRPHGNAKCRQSRGPADPPVPGKKCRHCGAPIDLVSEGGFMVAYVRDSEERHRCEAVA